jgi:hypothetical protein
MHKILENTNCRDVKLGFYCIRIFVCVIGNLYHVVLGLTDTLIAPISHNELFVCFITLLRYVAVHVQGAVRLARYQRNTSLHLVLFTLSMCAVEVSAFQVL